MIHALLVPYTVFLKFVAFSTVTLSSLLYKPRPAFRSSYNLLSSRVRETARIWSLDTDSKITIKHITSLNFAMLAHSPHLWQVQFSCNPWFVTGTSYRWLDYAAFFDASRCEHRNQDNIASVG